MFPRFAKLAVIAIGTLAVAGQAFAHAHLKASTPADKSTVTAAPTALLLNFTEALTLKFSGATLSGPQKTAIKTGDAQLIDHDMGLDVPLMGTLEPGAYTVEWHALSTDGHKTTGSFSFTVKP